RSTPAVSMNLWYKVGSRDEPAELQGMAHLLEHMMFNGSKGIPKNVHAHLIDAVGGVLNAFTTNDVTVYWNKVPSNLLGAVLQLEADRMVNLEITPEKVKVEKEVVKEEYRMGLQNDPLGTTLDKLLATSLEGTPYAWTPAGSIPGIAAITADDLKEFYQDYYAPNNAVLVIAGDTDIQEATRLAEEAFGAIEPGPVPHREAVLLPKREAPRYVDIAMPLQLPSILGGYIIPGTTSDERMALEIASLILSAGQSSRLHQQLVREQGLAVAAGGFAQPFRDIGLFLNLAFHLDHQDPDTIIKAMRDEIEGMAANPPSEEELEKARHQVAASYAFSLDSLDGIANAIGYAVVLGRGIGEFENAMDEYGSVTALDVQQVVAEYLRPENLTVFRVRPGEPPEGFLSSGEIEEDAADTKEKADMTSDALLQDLADQLGFSSPEAQMVELPAINHFQLENGLDVWLIERPHQPIASLQLFMQTGTYMEPVGKAGLANFTASMLGQGTKERTAEEIATLIDAAGGSLGAWADDDGTTAY
ncbi:MAG: insulinase family protein, partial [Firmicutes bacterium]|nr:insulinase family protein [Bacillota bacterium]